MTVLCTLVLLLAQQGAATLDQIRADSNAERRAKTAVEFAAMAERNAEAAYLRADMKAVGAHLAVMAEAVQLAGQALRETGKSPQGHPGPFKSGELRTEEILMRLGDLQKRMDSDERDVVEAPKEKVQAIHDEWFDGIMSRKKR